MLKKLSIASSKVEEISLVQIYLVKPVILPSYISKLHVLGRFSYTLLEVSQIRQLTLQVPKVIKKYDFSFVKSIKGLKETTLTSDLKLYLPHFPSSIMKIKSKFNYNCQEMEDCLEKLPNLIQIDSFISAELLEKLKLRKLNQVKGPFEGKFSVRPRHIVVNYDNQELLENHAELFERAEIVEISVFNFNLDYLHEKVGKVILSSSEVIPGFVSYLGENEGKFKNALLSFNFCLTPEEEKIVLTHFKRIRESAFIRLN